METALGSAATNCRTVRAPRDRIPKLPFDRNLSHAGSILDDNEGGDLADLRSLAFVECDEVVLKVPPTYGPVTDPDEIGRRSAVKFIDGRAGDELLTFAWRGLPFERQSRVSVRAGSALDLGHFQGVRIAPRLRQGFHPCHGPLAHFIAGGRVGTKALGEAESCLVLDVDAACWQPGSTPSHG